MGDPTHRASARTNLPTLQKPAKMTCSWRNGFINGTSETIDVKITPTGFSYYSRTNIGGWRGTNIIRRVWFKRGPTLPSWQRTELVGTENLATLPAQFVSATLKNNWCSSPVGVDISKILGTYSCTFSKGSNKAQFTALASFLTLFEGWLCPAKRGN